MDTHQQKDYAELMNEVIAKTVNYSWSRFVVFKARNVVGIVVDDEQIVSDL